MALSYCEKEILTHVSPVDHEKLMMILSCRRCGVLQVWEHGIGESRPNWMNAQAETLWAQHVMNNPQLVEEPKPATFAPKILDFHGTNTAECQWEIRKQSEPHQWRDATTYRLFCKKHGEICRDEITHFNSHYAVVTHFMRAWDEHLEGVEQEREATPIWTPPVTHHSPAVSLDQCERFLVERTDPQSSEHFLLLLCKRHGQIAELPLTPSNSWAQQKEMDKRWKVHLDVVSSVSAQPQRPKAPAPPKDGPGFGKIGKRKFG